MKVQTKLIVGFSIVVLLIWVITFVANNTFTEIHEEFELLEEDIIPSAIAMSEIEILANEVARESTGYIYSGEEVAKQRILSAIKQIENEGLEDLQRQTHIGQEEQKVAEELVEKIDTFSSGVVELVNMREQGESYDELLLQEVKVTVACQALIEQIGEHKATHMEELAQSEEAVHKAHTSGEQALFMAAGLITLLAAAVVVFTTRSIVNPLRALHRGTEIIGQGNFDYKVGTKTKDEIGQLSRAFDQMTKKLARTTTSIDNLNKEITERKQAEEALRESEEKYQAMINLGGRVGEAIIMRQDTDQGEGIMSFVSDEWCRITGYSKEGLLGMSFFDLLHPKDREASRGRYRKRMRGESLSGLFELCIIRKDGTEVPIELTSAYTTYQGKWANVAFIHDITERKKTEIEREKLIKDLEASLEKIQTLGGLIPICAWCKKIRDDKGYWESVEAYIGKHTKAEFTHGMCPECAEKYGAGKGS